MRRNSLGASCLLASLVTLLGLGSAAAQGVGDALVPATTRGFLSITNVKSLTDHWNQTQLGELMKDPAMKPFVDDLQQEIQNHMTAAGLKLGVTIDDLRGVSSGELDVAVLEPARGQEGFLLLAEVRDNVPKAQALLARISNNLVQQGARRTQAEVARIPVVVFELPQQRPETPPARAVYFLTDTWLGVADNLDVIAGVLARLGNKAGETLATVPAYQSVMARCRQDAGELVPQIRWFIEPFGYARAMRAAIPERDRPKGRGMVDILENSGFTGIQGVGGFVDFAVEGYESLHRTYVFAPPPHQGSLKMLVLPNGSDFTPQPWVPPIVATYLTGYAEPLAFFDNFGPLFDDLFGEGEKGVWTDVLEGLAKDPHGPQIDLRKELVEQLGQRFTAITDYQEPITTTSERMVFSIETKNESAVAAALDKMFRNDQQMRKQEVAGHVIWETVPQQQPVVPSINLQAVPPLVPQEAQGPAEPSQAPQLFPNAAITAANGQLYVASNLDALRQVLQKQSDGQPLSQSADYRQVEEKIGKLGIEQRFLQSFARTDEEYRVSYELLRQGKMPQAETLLGRLLNTVTGAGQKGQVRKQEIEGNKLPDYDVVRRYLGPAGLVGSTEQDGWFFKGFTLTRQAK